jgi:hypothetical protein
MGLYVLSAGARTRRSIVLGVGALQVKVVPASGSRVRQCICVICVWWPGGALVRRTCCWAAVSARRMCRLCRHVKL